MKTLRAWRAERLWSVDTLAEKAGVSNKTIVQLEHGRQLPTFRTIRRISDALSIPPSEVAEFNQAIAERGKAGALASPGPIWKPSLVSS
jgi:transcriptional regulator with XRE-family HTH domain